MLNTPTALTFPVSFTSSVYALTIGNVGEAVYNGNTCVYDITSNGCIIAFNARAYWVAIGIQQWGCNAKGNREVVFPIGFSNITYSFVYSLNYGSGAIAWDEVLPSAQADITSATYRTENKQKVGPRVGNWIVIGFQQWGTKAAFTYTWTYPLPLDVVYYADMMGYREDSAGNEYGWIRSISLIAFETYIIDESAICFCVGIAQQWGHKDSSTSIVTFNLSFPTTCFIALVETLNDGTVNCHLRVSGATNVGFSTWDSATNRPYSVQNYWLALGI